MFLLSTDSSAMWSNCFLMDAIWIHVASQEEKRKEIAWEKKIYLENRRKTENSTEDEKWAEAARASSHTCFCSHVSPLHPHTFTCCHRCDPHSNMYIHLLSSHTWYTHCCKHNAMPKLPREVLFNTMMSQPLFYSPLEKLLTTWRCFRINMTVEQQKTVV